MEDRGGWGVWPSAEASVDKGGSGFWGGWGGTIGSIWSAGSSDKSEGFGMRSPNDETGSGLETSGGFGGNG